MSDCVMPAHFVVPPARPFRPHPSVGFYCFVSFGGLRAPRPPAPSQCTRRAGSTNPQLGARRLRRTIRPRRGGRAQRLEWGGPGPSLCACGPKIGSLAKGVGRDGHGPLGKFRPHTHTHDTRTRTRTNTHTHTHTPTLTLTLTLTHVPCRVV